jgi:hypothetical protein
VFFKLPPLSEGDWAALGFRKKDTHPSTIPAEDAGSDYGVRIYYALSGEPDDRFPFRLAEPLKIGKVLPYSVFTRRKKERFDFNGESGSTVYFCLCYENSKGEAGPFGPVLSAVVP